MGKSSLLALGREILVSFDVVGRIGVNGPDASHMVGGTGRKVAYVRAEKDAGYVGSMRLERGDRD